MIHYPNRAAIAVGNREAIGTKLALFPGVSPMFAPVFLCLFVRNCVSGLLYYIFAHSTE